MSKDTNFSSVKATTKKHLEDYTFHIEDQPLHINTDIKLKSFSEYENVLEDIRYGMSKISYLENENELVTFSQYLKSGSSYIVFPISDEPNGNWVVVDLLKGAFQTVPMVRFAKIPHMVCSYFLNKIIPALYLDLGIEVSPAILCKMVDIFNYQSVQPSIRRPGKSTPISLLNKKLYIDYDSAGYFISDGIHHMSYSKSEMPSLEDKIVISAPYSCIDNGWFGNKSTVAALILPDAKAGFGKYLLNSFFLHVEQDIQFNRLSTIYIAPQNNVHEIVKTLFVIAQHCTTCERSSINSFKQEAWYPSFKVHFPNFPY